MYKEQLDIHPRFFFDDERCVFSVFCSGSRYVSNSEIAERMTLNFSFCHLTIRQHVHCTLCSATRVGGMPQSL